MCETCGCRKQCYFCQEWFCGDGEMELYVDCDGNAHYVCECCYQDAQDEWDADLDDLQGDGDIFSVEP